MSKENIPASLIIIIIIAVLISAVVLTYWQYSYKSNNIEEPVIETPGPEKEIGEQENNIIEPEDQTGTENIPESKDLIRKDFSYPYPVEWNYQHTKTIFFKYELTSVSLGKRKIPSFAKEDIGKEINALTLYFKITSRGRYDGQVCLNVGLRMVTSEEGDLVAPINRKFNAECFLNDQTYYNQEVIFEVPLDKKEFVITTGDDSNIFFTVKVLDNGDIKIIKEIPVG